MFCFSFQSDSANNGYVIIGNGWIRVTPGDLLRIAQSGVPFAANMDEHFRETLVKKFGPPVG